MSDSKARVIAHIMDLNPSATAAWLERFSDADLRQYLDHLSFGAAPRGNGWVRGDGSPFVTRRPAA